MSEFCVLFVRSGSKGQSAGSAVTETAAREGVRLAADEVQDRARRKKAEGEAASSTLAEEYEDRPTTRDDPLQKAEEEDTQVEMQDTE